MGKLSYALKRARKMDYRAMFKTADMLHKKTGKSRVWLMADMAKCAAKYNAGYVDYKITEMYRLNDAQRATQITRGISNSIVARMNDKKFWHFFDNKTEFNQLFHEQVKRKWLNFANATESQFAEFVQGRGDIICKPIDGSSGQGICKCTPEDYKDVQALYERLKAAGIGDKLPDLGKLREEYSRLSEEKDRLYAEYGSLKKRMREYDAVKQNIDSILSPNRGQEQDKAL